MSRVLNLLLTHQAPVAVARMLDWWRGYCPPDDVLVVYNGTPETFAQIDHPQKVRVEDPRLVTRDHQRERQSYGGVWRGAARWLTGQGGAFTHVHFTEYDHLPLVEGFNARQVARLEAERADVLGFQLLRVDGTNQPHYLYHLSQPGFLEHWARISVRREPGVVLSMFGSGSFWTRAAFEAVAAVAEPVPIYLEIAQPTTAHHLGYRLRDWGEQNRFVSSLGDFADRIEQAQAEGMWTLHPVKKLWNDPPPTRN